MSITQKPAVDFLKIREDFPILKQLNRGKPLIYFDSAASAQKPKAVIDAMSNFYLQDYANIHRGIYELSERSTHLYEQTREHVKQFLNAKSINEIVYVRGTTEGINLISQSLGRTFWTAGDEVILTVQEHHSNIVPWYLLRDQIGIELKVVPIHADGNLDLTAYQKLFSKRTKLVAFSHVSNAMGTINPAKKMTAIAQENGVPVLIDGAQAVPHFKVDVQDIGCDFYTFSAHKLYGPTGMGILYARKEWLDKMPPYQGGGDMIETVSFSNITFAKGPQKFEAGTPDIAAIAGFKTALHYLDQIGMNVIEEHGQALLAYAEKELLTIPRLRIIGLAKPKIGVISFVVDGIHPHDLATVLDHEGIAVRAGHHCAMPLMEYFSLPATVRVSFGIYNTKQEIDHLMEGLKIAKRLFE